jgi:preprotein translocase subunit SecG
MSRHAQLTIMTVILGLAFFALIAMLSTQYQQHQHDERMACIEHLGVFTEAGCAVVR